MLLCMHAHAEAAIAVPATRSGLSSPVFLIDPGKGLGSEPESYLNRKSHSLRIRLVIIRSRADSPGGLHSTGQALFFLSISGIVRRFAGTKPID